MDAITQGRRTEAFEFLPRYERHAKPRSHRITAIPGLYYTPLGKRALQDILETMGTWVDALTFAGGSFTLMTKPALEELIALCHEHGVLVSTGGFIERVLTQGSGAVAPYEVESNLGPGKLDRDGSRYARFLTRYECFIVATRCIA
jgi:phosphosulfolactate synthase (CoM biosynthesis protein A)